MSQFDNHSNESLDNIEVDARAELAQAQALDRVEMAAAEAVKTAGPAVPLASTPVDMEQVMKTASTSPADVRVETTAPIEVSGDLKRGKSAPLDPIKPSRAHESETTGYVRRAPSAPMDINDYAKGALSGISMASGIKGMSAAILAGRSLKSITAKATGSMAKSGLPGGDSFSAKQSLGLGGPRPAAPALTAAPSAPGMGLGGSGPRTRQAQQNLQGVRDEQRNREGLYMEDGETRREAEMENHKAEKSIEASNTKVERGAQQASVDHSRNPYYMEPKMAMTPKGPKFNKDGSFDNGDGDIYGA